jgi:hypothetical protein
LRADFDKRRLFLLTENRKLKTGNRLSFWPWILPPKRAVWPWWRERRC